MQLDPVITPEAGLVPGVRHRHRRSPRRKISALAVTEAALARIAQHDPVLNAFTDVTADRARHGEGAGCRDCGGQGVGPLAGVPFAVKNLFDVAGLPTRAGSKINRDPAPRRATRR